MGRFAHGSTRIARILLKNQFISVCIRIIGEPWAFVISRGTDDYPNRATTAQARAAELLQKTGLAFRPDELAGIEVADFGMGELEIAGRCPAAGRRS